MQLNNVKFIEIEKKGKVMSSMKTLSLKISLSILAGILGLICLTASIMLASFSTSTLTTPSINVSKISSQVWTNANMTMTTAVTESSQLTGGELYISATNNKTAIDIPCVMRVNTTFASVTTTTSWVKQSNGWYYYVGIVGGGHTGDYNTTTDTAVQFCSAYTPGSYPHITVELMQYSTVANSGFIREWAPLAGRTTDAKLNDEYTVDGRSLTPKAGTKYTGPFALFKTETETETVKWKALPVSSDAMTNMTLNKDSTTNTATLSYNGTDKVDTTAWTPLKIYNNATVPMVYQVTISTTVGVINTITHGDDDDNSNWKVQSGATGTKKITYVYGTAVLPGQYLSFANTLTISGYDDKTTTNISIAISAIDVDTALNNESQYGSITGTNGVSISAPFTTWIKNLYTYVDGTTSLTNFTKPTYTTSTTQSGEI